MNPLSASFLGATLALLSTLAQAQTFPIKTITFVVPFAAGAGTDQLARALGENVASTSGQTVVVENRPGANGFIALQQVARATPDGYTVLITTNSTQVVNAHLFKKLPYDPVADFAPITTLGKGGQFMLVTPNSPAKTVGEFVAMAKKEPGKYSFGAGSSQSRVGVELMQQMAGMSLLHIPYNANANALTDLLGGQIDMMMADTTLSLPQIKGGKVRALGYSGEKRSPLAPEVPTVAEAGVPGYESTGWYGVLAPSRTPASIIARLHRELTNAISDKDVRERFFATGVEPMGTTPEQFAAYMRDEYVKWGKVVKATGAKPE